jgi:CheY-like chemotaxis protein
MICFLIDDNIIDREIFLAALNTLDNSIKLVTADSGVQALEKINGDNSFLPDYIFLDLNMPYMSGKECLIKLRAIERLKNVPIIIYSTIKDFEDLTSHGATSFITKKNSVADLAKALSDIIKKPL